MKSFIFLLALLPVISFCQDKRTNIDSIPNAFGDSTSVRRLCNKYSPAHQLMVPFTEGSTADLNNFWTYLLSELHYKTDMLSAIKFKPAALGLSTVFFKYGDGFELLPNSITVNLICSQKGTNLKSAYITGDNDLLTEIFIKYFGGTTTRTSPSKGFYTTYTTTDEVRLLPNKIIISPR